MKDYAEAIFDKGLIFTFPTYADQNLMSKVLRNFFAKIFTKP